MHVITFKSRQFISPCSEISNSENVRAESKTELVWTKEHTTENKQTLRISVENRVFVDCFHILPTERMNMRLAHSIQCMTMNSLAFSEINKSSVIIALQT